MARYPLGGPVNIPLTVTDPVTGALTNAGSQSLVVKIRNADGTTTNTAGSPYTTPTLDSTGKYHQLVPASDLGTVAHYQWVNTVTGAGAGVTFGGFEIFDPAEASLLTLADAKDALNIPQATLTYDNELLQYIETIESCLERMTGGPIINTSVTERAEMTAGQTILQVRQRPLVSVSQIVSTASGTAIDISAGLDLDPNAGTIRRKLAYPFYGPFFAWLPVVNITYVAGWGTQAPAAFAAAARIIIDHLWQTQHGPSVRPGMGAGELVTPPGFGFAIPQQAAELLNGSQGGIPFMCEAYV